MEIKLEYGKWYECKKGTMPEDIVYIIKDEDKTYTDDVLIPFLWGNQYGSGSIFPTVREYKDGEWRWNQKGCRPLIWMEIPPLKKEFISDGKGRVEYGKWIRCKEGSMPEDFLDISTYKRYSFAGEVIIPQAWGDGRCIGKYLPVLRRKNGDSRWAWDQQGVKPSYWLAIPDRPRLNLQESKSINELKDIFVIE